MKEKSAIFATGAAGYSCIELLARGHTHWTMAVLGGVCLLCLLGIARQFASLPILVQAGLGACVITVLEFATGLIVNLALGWNVWNYGHEFGNVLGQICPLFSFLWFLLCIPVFGGIRLFRKLRTARTADDLLENES